MLLVRKQYRYHGADCGGVNVCCCVQAWLDPSRHTAEDGAPLPKTGADKNTEVCSSSFYVLFSSAKCVGAETAQ
jgi:hypothetical protein